MAGSGSRSASSSVTVRVTASGAVTSAPLTVPEILTLASGASALLSTAVTVTVPLCVAFAAMVRVEPLNRTLPEGEADSVTVTAEETAFDSLALSVVELFEPLSSMRDDPSDSDTLGFAACTVMTGERAYNLTLAWLGSAEKAEKG